ncbi:hypothetical protein IID24_05720 [Patescibacteria group bacterium]|nr:hypothetical protein [Patescibacteria group bacterium]
MVKQVIVKIATDAAFRSNYWAFSSQQIKTAATRALAIFCDTFPGVELTLLPQVDLWESKDFPLMRDFPMSLLLDLPRYSSFERAVEALAEKAQQLGFREESEIRAREALDIVISNNRGKTKHSRFWYLMGFLDSAFAEEMLYDLKECRPSDGTQIVLGFTGKLFVIERDLGGCLGVAFRGGNHAVLPIQYKQRLSPVILHEVGHLFGAVHPEGEDVVSIMNNEYLEKTTRFDPENIELIHQRIKGL